MPVRTELRPNEWREEVPQVGNRLYEDGVLYFGDRSGTLTALRSRDGKVLWRYGEGHSTLSAPTAWKNLVLFSSRRGITAVRRREGRGVWARDIPDGAAESSPVVQDKSVFVGGYDGNIYVFDAGSGELRWKFRPSRVA